MEGQKDQARRHRVILVSRRAALGRLTQAGAGAGALDDGVFAGVVED